MPFRRISAKIQLKNPKQYFDWGYALAQRHHPSEGVGKQHHQQCKAD